MAQDAISEAGKCSDSRSILKVELIGSADGYDGGFEEKRVVGVMLRILMRWSCHILS